MDYNGYNEVWGTKQQHDEFAQWCANNRPRLSSCIFPWEGQDDSRMRIAILPMGMDRWILQNCPLPYITDAIKSHYQA